MVAFQISEIWLHFRLLQTLPTRRPRKKNLEGASANPAMIMRKERESKEEDEEEGRLSGVKGDFAR